MSPVFLLSTHTIRWLLLHSREYTYSSKRVANAHTRVKVWWIMYCSIGETSQSDIFTQRSRWSREANISGWISVSYKSDVVSWIFLTSFSWSSSHRSFKSPALTHAKQFSDSDTAWHSQEAFGRRSEEREKVICMKITIQKGEKITGYFCDDRRKRKKEWKQLQSNFCYKMNHTCDYILLFND